MFNLTTKPVSAGELMKKEKKPINFVVEKFISQGVHFLAGHPKSGKSWLSLWLALCVSNGNDLWGFKTNKSKVLYFCLEDTEKRIQCRILLKRRAEPTAENSKGRPDLCCNSPLLILWVKAE